MSAPAGSRASDGPPELTGAQRKYLRGLAHELDPVVQIGKGGLAEGQLENLDQALADHELVKVKFIAQKDKKKELAAAAVARLGACEVGAIGHVVIFYRPALDEKKRAIALPHGGGGRRRPPAGEE